MPLDTDAPSTTPRPDDALYQQCANGVRQMEAQLGRPYDDNSERLSASLAVLAHESGLQRVDHVLLSERNAQVGQGEHVFIVQGALGDPAQLRAHMRTEDAVALTVQQSVAKLQKLQQDHQLAASIAPVQHAETPQLDPHRLR
ncbi:hypothetical protein SAMN05428989_3023 [Pseudoxanthomonas sp. GM95]|uniref:XVIPCD domain-containing protein n=1 Tax=Pseudoxanthomonas sp. GM95 TaxID=1881043 RepID=UPI0008D56EA5|nr:XVIPCD domain-containing protein [Pseudoxanthomonas sp. GM95]SEM09143.1 hypothetical protein SAMN05428989_3023 [Pseudoxanthomonas sp. GM95]